eukprot:5641193-Karenia_brevis.AAC.1
MWQDWTSRAEYASLAPRPYIEPLAQYVKAKGSTAQKSAIASDLISRGAVTQSVLHDWGRVDSPA